MPIPIIRAPRRWAFGLAGLLLLGPSDTPAQLAAGPSVLASEGRPDRVLVADFDSDGVLDLIATAPETNRLGLHFGRGNGLFRFPFYLFVGSGLSDMALADIDGNGELDLVGTDAVSGELVLMHQFRGTQATYRLSRLPGEDEPSALQLLDLEPDGDTDVVVAYPGADAIGIYRNESGLQLPRLQKVGDGPHALGTLNPTVPSARRFLLAQGGVLSRNLIVYDDQWTPLQQLGVYPIAGILPLSWNGDAWLDFVLVDQSGWARPYLGGSGDFVPAVSWSISPGATQIAPFHALDGRVGAAVVETAHNRLSVHIEGQSSVPDAAWFLGGGAMSVASADLENNGDTEYVIPVPQDNLLLIMRRNGDGLRGYRSHRSGELPSRMRGADAVGGLSPRLYVLCAGDATMWIYDRVGSELVPRTPLSLLSDARDFRVAQMDSDGLPDLVVLSLSSGLQIFYSQGAGFAAPQSVPMTGDLRDVEVVDLDGDEILDLAVADQEPFGVRLFLADGFGGYSETDTLICLDRPVALRSDDFDRDGRQDILAVGTDRRPCLFYANDNGEYQRTNWLLGHDLRGVAVGNFNGDIYPDIAIGNAGDQTYSVLASLQPRFHIVSEEDRAAPDGSETMVALDVSGDGLDDLVLSSSTSRSASVHIAIGAGHFAPPSRVRCSTLPLDLSAFDTDGDGVHDIVITDGLGASVVALRVVAGAGQPLAGREEPSNEGEWQLGELRVTPNPARGLVQMTVHSPERAPELRVFDLRGRLVARLAPRAEGGGLYRAQWDSQAAAAGRYYVQARVGNRQLVRPVVCLPH